MGSYRRISGLVFAIVALGHAGRALAELPLTIGSTSVPVWVSWLFAGVAFVLSIWGLAGRK